MSTPTDNRIRPLARLLVWNKGQGDPYAVDHGFGWYDVLLETGQLGTYDYDGSGASLLELLPEIGLTCRPTVNLQDTRLDQFITSGGTWEERRPAAGAPRLYRLIQLDTTPGVTWSATSATRLPENPHVAFSFIFVDTPADEDASLFPPFVRIEFGPDGSGQAQWAIEFSKSDGARLLRWLAGLWIEVEQLPQPAGDAQSANDEKLVILRCLRGRIGVSTDAGQSYQWFGFATPEVDFTSPTSTSSAAAQAAVPITVGAGPFTVRGQGGMCVFGVHQVAYSTGHYGSTTRNTFTSRLFVSAVLSARSWTPYGTTVALADASDSTDGVAAYTATLTPVTLDTGGPWLFYAAPELYAVAFQYPVTTAGGSGTWSEPFDAHTTPGAGILEAEIDKPFELDGAKASVRVRLNPQVQFNWSPGRWTKVRLLLGELDSNGVSVRWYTAFTGYLESVTPSADEYGTLTLALEIDNPAVRFRRREWTEFDAVPLGGQTINQALDAILASEGLPPALYRSWHPWGDAFPLPPGLPEEPFEFPKPGEAKWETMVRIAGYAGLQLVPMDDGTFVSLPRQWVNPFSYHLLEATPQSNLKALILGIKYKLDSTQSCSAVLVRGTDYLTGMPIWAWAVDADAESNPFSSRFSPWREYVTNEIPGSTNLGNLVSRAGALALEHFPLKLEPDVTFPADLGWSRRDLVQISPGSGANGVNVGVNAWDQFVVLSLHHTWTADPSFEGCRTTAGLRRLNG